MIRLRVVSSLIFGICFLALGLSCASAADDGHATNAQKRQDVAKQLEGEASAKVKEDIEEAIPGHQKNEHNAHEDETSKNPLDFKKDLALFTAIVFIVLLLILWKFAWKPICTALDNREQAVADQIAVAAKRNEEARQILAQYDEKLASAKDEVRDILDKARQDAEGVGQEIVEAAKKDSQAEHQRAMREIDAATGAALKELAQKSATMAVELAGKIVGSELRAADHAKLVEQTVAQFAADDK
ncbi:MAG: F0F1 ATP synthase subunit B [Pirellulales bacterium]|nr:F0F1 ATP synthase subunit B [Pirellulales bacterium]